MTNTIQTEVKVFPRAILYNRRPRTGVRLTHQLTSKPTSRALMLTSEDLQPVGPEGRWWLGIRAGTMDG